MSQNRDRKATIHHIKLNPGPFYSIKTGAKTIEIVLLDTEDDWTKHINVNR